MKHTPTPIVYCSECHQSLTDYGVEVHNQTCEGVPEKYLPKSSHDELLEAATSVIQNFQTYATLKDSELGKSIFELKKAIQKAEAK